MSAKTKPTPQAAEPTQASAQSTPAADTQATPEPSAWFKQDAFGREGHMLVMSGKATLRLMAALSGIEAITTVVAEHNMELEGDRPLFHHRTVSGLNEAIGVLTHYVRSLTMGGADSYLTFVADHDDPEAKELEAWRLQARRSERLRQAYATTQIHQQGGFEP